MSTIISRHNSLLSRLGSIGNLEHTIEFEAESTSQSPTLSGATIRWYNDLSTRKVQYLQLCREGAQHHAVITLEDGSIFQLKFTRSTKSGGPRSVCSLFRLSENSRLLSMCLFSIEGVGDVAYPISDMKFIIAICLPLCQSLDPTRASHETLFALALTTAVARKCVDIKNEQIAGTGTPLDDFWSDIISSTKSANQPLWEEAIVDSVHDQVRNWVFLKAREHVAECLFRGGQEEAPAGSTESFRETEKQGLIKAPVQKTPSPTQRQAHSGTLDERERHSAASVVAWLEFLSPRQVANCLTLWDKTWNSTWEREWGKAWIKFWAEQQDENNLRAVTPTQFTDHVPLVTGRVSGKIAGKIPIDTNAMFEFMVKMPGSSLLEWEYEHTRQFRDTGESIRIYCKGVDFLINRLRTRCKCAMGQWYPATTKAQGKEVMWFESWRCLRYPNPLDSWLPSWELAVVMAWVLRWEKAVEAGQIQESTHKGATHRWMVAGPITLSPKGSQEQLPDTVLQAERKGGPQGPRLKSKHSRNRLVTTTRLLGQIKDRYQKRIVEQPDIETTNPADQVSRSYQGNPVCLLEKVVDFAWNIASNTPESPESNLLNAADSAFHSAKRNFGRQVASRIAPLPKEKWRLIFKDAWKETWKQCWREAWAAVMKEAEKVVSARGIQEGISCARDDEDRRLAQEAVPPEPSNNRMIKLEPTVILSHNAQASLEQIKGKMLHTSLPVDYRRCVPSIFMSLEQLYQAMSHSSPVIHPNMEIKMFEEKPLLQAIVYAKSKTKALWERKPEEESFRIVSHTNFQHEVKRIIEDVSEDWGLDRPVVQWMAEVWQEAIAISSSTGQGFIPEISEPKNTFKTLPLRTLTYYNGQRANPLNPREESQHLGGNYNRGSVFTRIFNSGKAGI